MSRSTTTVPTQVSSACSAFVVAVLGAGCAGYGPGDLKPGQGEAEVRLRMGEPSERVAQPDGSSRLDYARGPMGLHTWRIELDAEGRVRGWSQLLTEPNFDAIVPGMARGDVQARLGLSTHRQTGWRGVGEVWSYRFESPFCRWFQVWLVDGVVREAAFAPDPACEDRRHDND